MVKLFFCAIVGLYFLVLLDIFVCARKNNIRKNKIKEYPSVSCSKPIYPEQTETTKEKVTACFLNGDISVPVKSSTFKELEMQKTKKDADVITLSQDIADAMKENLETEIENELYKDYKVFSV